MAMDLHDGGVDNRVFHIRIVRDGLEQPFEDVSFNPVAEACVHTVPVSEHGWQVAPWAARVGDPKHPLHEQPIVLSRSAGIARFAETILERVRILNIDAPETRGSCCERELVLGLKAKERLAGLLRAGSVDIVRDGEDRDSRTLARVSVSGIDVGSVLIGEGLALPWRDGPEAREVQYWCGPL